MKWCTVCNHTLVIQSAVLKLVFACNNCGRQYDGNPKDTLLLDEQLAKVGGEEATVQSAVLIENAPFDAAARRELVQCPSCGLPYMSLVILEEGLRVYRCKCGHVGNSVTS